MKRAVLGLVLSAAFTAVPAVAVGQSFAVTNLSPVWSFACAVSGACGSTSFTSVTLDNSNADDIRLSWPATGTPYPSGYGFMRIATPFNVVLSSGPAFFSLGTFTHYNFVIPPNNPAGTLASADMKVSFNISGNAIEETYGFEHWETPNAANPCPGGFANPCPDRVTFINTESFRSFTVDGQSYNLRLAGFSADGGATLTDAFWSDEGATNSTTLYASIEVPEPAGLVVFAAGLALAMATGSFRRRQQ